MRPDSAGLEAPPRTVEAGRPGALPGPEEQTQPAAESAVELPAVRQALPSAETEADQRSQAGSVEREPPDGPVGRRAQEALRPAGAAAGLQSQAEPAAALE